MLFLFVCFCVYEEILSLDLFVVYYYIALIVFLLIYIDRDHVIICNKKLYLKFGMNK
jgi:hypothetical protein